MDISTLIRERRSIRKYQDRDVPREVIAKILEDALWAPSALNRQNWQIVAVRGEQKEKLVEAVAETNKYFKPRLEKLFSEKIVNVTLQFLRTLGGAPVLLLVYIPKLVAEIRPGMSSLERYHHEQGRLTSFLSAAALMQNILLLATAEGLGTCWMTAPKIVEDEINEVLGIEGQELVSVIPMGYPDYPDQKPPAPPRKDNKVRWIGFEQK
ncbi:MAG: nitroreductase family protein [Desulfotomaculaceae bacterium]|nr:nitroreductase family protein [Desulfotomaculaceae bacterium]